MDSKNQFTVFCFCVVVGFLGGIVYEVFAFFRALFGCGKGKNKLLGAVCDVLFFIVFAALCVAAAFILEFPRFRVYMWLGYAVGGIIYAKTLRRIVAFSEKVCYNILIKAVKKAKSKKKLSKTREEKV